MFRAMLLGLLFAMAVVQAEGAETERPNILWLSTEDISPQLGCYGEKHAITPTLDQLAADGVRYTNAYTVAGVCAPNRTGIILGMYPTSVGGHHMRCKATLPDQIRCFPTYLREAGYYCTNNSKTDYNFSVSTSQVWDESSKKAHWKNCPEGKPFFAVFNYTNTHEGSIRATGKSYAQKTARLTDDQRQDPDALELPPYYPDTPVVRNDWKKYFELITGLDYWVADHLQALEEAGLAENTIVFFWSDHGVGLPRAKRWLYDSGTRVPLIIRIPSKFRGAGQGSPDVVCDDLVSSIDFGPTVLNLAGVSIPTNMCGRPFLGNDLPPARDYIYGIRDRMDERYDCVRSVRDRRFRYLRNYESFKPYAQYMNTPEGGPTMMELRRLQALGQLPPAAEQFMADTKPVEEFYDLENDPHEIHNLAGDPKWQAEIDRFRKAHLAWMDKTRDLGLIPEPELTAGAQKLGSEWAILDRPDASQILARLRRLVRAGEQGEEGMDDLVAALGAKCAAERFWAATGLGNLGAKGSSQADHLKKMLGDDSPVVRIAAARALCLMGQEQDALDTLVEQLASEHQWVRLHAAIVLDTIGDKARPATAALRTALGDKQNKYVVRVANHALNELEGTQNRVP